MISLDTNILARFYIIEPGAEERKQHDIASRTMEQPALFVARTVLLELEWVMRGVYGHSRGDVTKVMDNLTGLRNVTIENWDIVSDALRAYKDGLDFADALHLAASRGELFATFDTGLAKRADKLELKPHVTDANAKT
jgi:predicted nucleic-acid-binding protein